MRYTAHLQNEKHNTSIDGHFKAPKKGVSNAVNFAPAGGLRGERLQAVCYSKPPLVTCAADFDLGYRTQLSCVISEAMLLDRLNWIRLFFLLLRLWRRSAHRRTHQQNQIGVLCGKLKLCISQMPILTLR